MVKSDDAILQIFDYIESNWISIFIIFICLASYMVYITINNIKYETPEYKVTQIAVIEKMKNLF